MKGAKYRVMWLRNGKERKSPWFRNEGRAQRLYELFSRKGYPAIVYVD